MQKRRQKWLIAGGIDEERRCGKKEKLQREGKKATINIALKSW